MVLLPWLNCITSHVCESCSDARVWVGHGFIVAIGCSEKIEGDEEACALGASSVEWDGRVAFEGSVDINVGRLRCLLRLLLSCWLSLLLLLLLLLLRLLLRLLELLSNQLGLYLRSWLSHWCWLGNDRGWWGWVLDDNC